MMNVLLNFYPVQSGGGQQVAMNFLRTISDIDFGHKWFVYVGEKSELHELALKVVPHDRILSSPYSYLRRFLNKNILNDFINYHKIDIIYNYAPILSVKSIPQVVRSVYSNLYFPEIDFWNGYPWGIKMRKKLIDRFRLNGTIKANGLIFENMAMQDRAKTLFDYPQNKTIYIEPSVTNFDVSNLNDSYNILQEIRCYKVLYLSSWHLNKNIFLLPEIASLLKIDNIKVKFILSLEPDHRDVKKMLVSQIDKFNVSDYFIFIGKVRAEYVHQVVTSTDAMILLSKLECFSSNIVEAFYFRKPLIISDEEWARAACSNAALYVNRDDSRCIKNVLVNLINNPELQKVLVENGMSKLKTFNTPFEKVKKQIKFLERIYESHKIIN